MSETTLISFRKQNKEFCANVIFKIHHLLAYQRYQVIPLMNGQLSLDQDKRLTESSTSNDMLERVIVYLKEALPAGAQYYEYKTIVVKDSEIIGSVDAERIELILCKLALEGWRLKAAVTNEIGHNKAVVVNATINNTILILERLVTKE